MQQGMMMKKKKSRSRLAGIRSGHWLPITSSSRSGADGRKLLRLRVCPARVSTATRKRREEEKVLARSVSEPALLVCGYGTLEQRFSPPPPLLERPHTCYDIFASDSTSALSTSTKEAKVIVNVTVEGSPGPVKVMVRLAATIDEAIAAAVERYGREGRSPRLDPASADAFQLHHSHFSLQSLNKNDKIGDVGGRNFYLHKNGGCNGLFLGYAGESGVSSPSGAHEPGEIHGGHPLVDGAPYYQHHHDQYLAIIIKKLDKIGRRTKRIWRVLTCNCT